MRLDEVAHEFGDSVEIEWRSYLLRPKPTERTRDEFREYTKSWMRAAEVEPMASFRVWSTDNDPPSHSMPVAIAGKVAREFGPAAFSRFHHAMLRAYFAENRTISDLDVITEIVDESGLDIDAFLGYLSEHEKTLRREVISDHNAAIEMGVTGVPTVVINHEHPFTGALDLEIYRKMVMRLASAPDDKIY